jgi:hypothetical protein
MTWRRAMKRRRCIGETCGDGEHAELERRNAAIERAAAELERDRVDFIERKRAAPGT